MGNEAFCEVSSYGEVQIPSPIGKSLYLSNIFFAPTMTMIVISLSQLAMNGFKDRFKGKKVMIGMAVKF